MATSDGWPRLHVVTDDATLAEPGFRERALELLEAGGSSVALHVRGPRTPVLHLHDVALELGRAARRCGARLVVNDRVDVAASVDADGVQLGRRSLPLAAVRALREAAEVPRRLAIGVSVHDLDAARAARKAEWLLVGTLFATPSHPGRTGAGTGLVERLSAELQVPLIGIGGVTPDRVPALLDAGAHGVAVLRGVWHPEGGSTAGAVRDYLEALAVRARPDPPIPYPPNPLPT